MLQTEFEIKMVEPITIRSKVRESKEAGQLCRELFPEWFKPPFLGELQRLVIDANTQGASTEQISLAGHWWLWVRELFIENTITRPEKSKLMKMAISASRGRSPIHFVTARSPELLHAQIEGQGDKSLPRSKKSVSRFSQICTESSQWLPTEATIIFADLAIDNLTNIVEACNPLEIIAENVNQLQKICSGLDFGQCALIRMSELTLGDNQQLGQIVEMNGTPKVVIDLDDRAKKMVGIVLRESIESHQRMFGWTEDQSRKHNTNLAITMGLVGQAVARMNPSGIIIHNESFIARGQLNNLFTPPDNPVPVICLKDLLETKKKE